MTKILNFERCRAFGHSRGGQAAATARMLDPRVRGGVNLDGAAGDNVVIPVNEGDTSSGAQPFLWIQGSLPPAPTDEQLQRMRRTRAEYDARIQLLLATWHRKLSEISGGALRVYIDRPGIQHIDFSDEPDWDGAITAANRPGRLQTIADTRAWVRAFFDGVVRGEWESLKRLANDKSQPEVTVHQFGRMWPE